MSDLVEKTCPLCAEEMDPTDQQLKPCKCGYQICVWCWHHIVDMAEKDQTEGRCPACRTPYDKEKIVGATVNCDSLVPEGNKKVQKAKSKPSDGKKQLTSVRVIRRNLVYIIGLPLNLADEDLLHHKEYFGQYGKVLKVSMSRTASGVIQQFPNNTCSVYITYGKEEEAVRCIQAVHGFILDGKPLKACFGTTKYCHAWLRNFPCVNPDCLYLHEVGSQEDSFTKDEIISAYTRNRVQQITGATNIPQNRSGSMLPPPLDAYCSDGSSMKPIVKVPSTNTTTVPRYSPPSGSGSSSRSSALPAAASWGTHIANQQSLATSITSNGSSDKQRSTSENGTLAFSAVVANTAHGPMSSSDVLKRQSIKEESQTVVERSKSNVLKPAQNNAMVDSGSKGTTSPDRDPSSNRFSNSVDSSNGGRDVDKPSAAVNSIDASKEDVEDSPSVSNLSVGVARMGITTNSRDERPDIPVMIGSQCDQGSIRQPGHVESKLSHVEECRIGSSVNGDEKAISSEDVVPSTRPEWDWRSGLQNQMQVSSNVKLEDISSFDSQRHHPAEDDISHSRFLSSSSSAIFSSNNLGSVSSRPFENSGVKDSDMRSSLDRGSDRLHLPNGFGENSVSNVDHSLFSNEGRNKVRSAEDDLISNILSLDFDPWDETSTTAHNLAELLGEVDQQSSTLKPSNLLKKHNSQSRFSFARQEESSSQAFDSENYNIYGHFSRNQPSQESVGSRDIYRHSSGNLNGFSSNYSGGSENFAASPLLSSYRNPVSRPQVSAPPGFSAPSRLPPPGFPSHERVGQSSDTAQGTRFLDLRNAYQVQPPLGNHGGSSGDLEFVDPAILAVGRGMVNADLDKRLGFSSQLNSFENEAGLQMLRRQHSLSAAQQQVNGFRNMNNLSPSLNDPYGFGSRQMDHQTQGNSLSHFSQLPRQQQPSANSILSNGHWDKWNEGQSVNPLGMAELLRNGSLYNNGYEEPKFRIPSPGDVYNRTYGM